jgi:large subunit ribosomal protein L24
MEMPVPLSTVRLVHKLTDPHTGYTRDVVVQRVELREVWHDRTLGIHRRARIIPGLANSRGSGEELVPWPRRERVERVEHDADTPRLDVEARTWVPTLLRPPMPPSVIDELRNKYSKFRDRHDEAYVARKIAALAEAEAERARLVAAAATPAQEAKRRERQLRKARGWPELTDEMLARIGEVMARNRPALLPPQQSSPGRPSAAAP